MAKKYFCWNIDDGLEQDKKVIEILRRYNMGATFNLNAGLFGYRNMTRWENNRPLCDVTMEEYRAAPATQLFVEHFHIPADEVTEVYQGYEIAAHCYRHENMAKLTREEMAASITADREALAQMFGQSIRGFAYPYGIYNDTAVDCLRECGIRYARTTERTESLAMPKDLLRLPMTAWHSDSDVHSKLDAFFRAETDEDLFFLMFAHGFEFDFGTPESNWTKLEKLCEYVAKQSGIICCSTAQALGLKQGNY